MELIDTPWLILFFSLCIVILLWVSHYQNNTSSSSVRASKSAQLSNSVSENLTSENASSVNPPPSLYMYPNEIKPGQPANVDRARIAGDRLGPLDPAIYQPPTVAPSGGIFSKPNLSGLSATDIIAKPNEAGLRQLGSVKIPVDYLPLPHNPALAPFQTPNFASEGLLVDAFYKKQPLVLEGAIPKPILVTGDKDVPLYNPAPGEQPPAYERSMKAGSLTTSQYQPDYWTYSGEKIQNGGNWGGILAYEPNAAPSAAYPNPRLEPAEHGWYPNENPNSNSIGIPALPARKDDLRMGLGVPAYQGAFVNERVPM